LYQEELMVKTRKPSAVVYLTHHGGASPPSSLAAPLVVLFVLVQAALLVDELRTLLQAATKLTHIPQILTELPKLVKNDIQEDEC
jgi:hypothetical protein